MKSRVCPSHRGLFAGCRWCAQHINTEGPCCRVAGRDDGGGGAREGGEDRNITACEREKESQGGWCCRSGNTEGEEGAGEIRILETRDSRGALAGPGGPSCSPLLLSLPVVRQTGPICLAQGRGLSKVQPASRRLQLLQGLSQGFLPPARLHLGRDSVSMSSLSSGGFQVRREGPAGPGAQ